MAGRLAEVDITLSLKHLSNHLVTEMLGTKEDPKLVAAHGGWASEGTPLKIYAAWRPARDAAAANRPAGQIDGQEHDDR